MHLSVAAFFLNCSYYTSENSRTCTPYKIENYRPRKLHFKQCGNVWERYLYSRMHESQASGFRADEVRAAVALELLAPPPHVPHVSRGDNWVRLAATACQKRKFSCSFRLKESAAAVPSHSSVVPAASGCGVWFSPTMLFFFSLRRLAIAVVWLRWCASSQDPARISYLCADLISAAGLKLITAERSEILPQTSKKWENEKEMFA